MPETNDVAISDVGTKLFVNSTTEETKITKDEISEDKITRTVETEITTLTGYFKVIPITAAPATGAAPSPIEVTELESGFKQYIADRPDTPTYEFEANYIEKTYEKLGKYVDLNDKNTYFLAYGDKSGEKFEATGSYWVKEVSLGSPVKVGISFSVQSHEHSTKENTKALLKYTKVVQKIKEVGNKTDNELKTTSTKATTVYSSLDGSILVPEKTENLPEKEIALPAGFIPDNA